MWPEKLLPEDVEGCRVFADRYELIKSLSSVRGGRIAEVGVLFGAFSQFLMERLKPTEFHAYDIFQVHTMERHGPHDVRRILNGLDHETFYRRKFAAAVEAGRMRVHRGDSSTLLGAAPDRSFDMIYIDGDHSLDGARKDAAVAAAKIRESGVLVFNDYTMIAHANGKSTFYGVVHAVNDLCRNHGWRMAGFALQGAMYCDVALVRK